ncbi:MAG: GHKL domain-containing protein [Clostridia bacterium]|nr:GHKL domain-containing protein [Clostridia bacterium]
MSWYIGNGLVLLQMVAFLFVNMKTRINKTAAFFIIAVPYITWALLQKTLTQINPPLHVAVGWVIFIALTWLLFDETVKTKVFVIALDMVINYVSAIFLVVISEIVSADVQTVTPTMAALYVTLNGLLLTLFSAVRKRIKISNYNLSIFIAIAIIQLLFAEVSALFLVYGKDMNLPEIPFLKSETDPFVLLVIVVACLFYVVSDIVLFVMMRKLTQSEKEKEEMRFAEYKNEISLDYYRSIEKNAEEARKIRHDMANILQIVGSLVDGDEKEKEYSQEILTQIKGRISEIHLEKYTENSLVNAIVSNKASVCRDKGIKYDFDIQIPSELDAEKADICNAYVNILDNAINAVSGLSEDSRRIELRSVIEDGKLIIASKNRFDTEKREKKRSDKHGFGQKILRDIAKKYDGSFMTEQQGDMYTALLVINV